MYVSKYSDVGGYEVKISRLSRVIAIPDYWHDQVNPDIDLRANPKQPCPFHHEEHGESLSYSEGRDYFSCFGKCHVFGGNVVQMHMLNYKIKDYDKAEESLARLYGISLDKDITFTKPEVHVSEKDIAFRVAYAQACDLAKTPEDWLELDYTMSQYPPSIDELKLFINKRRVFKKEVQQ